MLAVILLMFVLSLLVAKLTSVESERHYRSAAGLPPETARQIEVPRSQAPDTPIPDSDNL